MSATMDAKKVRTMIWRMLFGAIFGGAASLLFFEYVAEPNIDLKDPSLLFGSAIGVVYLLIGLMVVIGALAPKTGAHFLNVENAEELREERQKIGTSGAACLLIGIFMLVLSLAGTAIDSQLALILAGACLAGTVVLTVAGMRHYDELTRHLALEASAWGFYATLVVTGGWAALAHLGFVAWISPIAFVGLLFVLQLLMAFVAVGLRGMMLPR